MNREENSKSKESLIERNKSLEKALEMVEKSLIEQRKQNKQLLRFIGYLIKSAGGAVIIPQKELVEGLVAKSIISETDAETGDYIFKVIDTLKE